MRLRRIGLAIGIAAAAAAAGGTQAATPLGGDRVVELADGRRIALSCSGRGRYTVLLEPGDGGRRTHMAKLFEALAARYRVCAYDRRNVGLSSSAPLPRKAADLTADAFDALRAAGEDGPFILFGTSLGGLIVRLHAANPSVVGFVTSNQPGTSREWSVEAHPVMSRSQRAVDDAWLAGDNNEHIDVNDVSGAIAASALPSIPHVIMISTERFQCKAAELCGPLYRAFVATSRRAAVGSKGRLRVINGDHDLYVTNLDDVIAAIDEVAAAAKIRR